MNWETKVREWALQNNFSDQTTTVIPKEIDTIHTLETQPKISDSTLTPSKTEYQKNDVVVVRPIFNATYPIVQVDYFINDEYAGSIKRSPFEFTIRLENAYIGANEIPIRIKAYDSVSNTVESVVIIRL